MKYILLFSLILPLFLYSCGNEEDDLTPSRLERDWFVLEDRPDDPLDHSRYLIYKEYGIPVFYNDTIGSMIRIDLNGNEYPYYEVLQVFYSPGNAKPLGHFALHKDRMELHPAIEYLRGDVLKRLPKTIPLQSVLLVDSLIVLPAFDAFPGLNSLTVRVPSGYAESGEQWKRELRANLLGGAIRNTLNTAEMQVWKTESFWQLTLNVNPVAGKDGIYSYTAGSGITVGEACRGSVPALEPKLAVLGFLEPMITYVRPPGVSYFPEEEAKQWTPTRDLDFNTYLRYVFLYTPAEFTEKYGEYKVILAKYQVVKERLGKIGFKFD